MQNKTTQGTALAFRRFPQQFGFLAAAPYQQGRSFVVHKTWMVMNNQQMPS